MSGRSAGGKWIVGAIVVIAAIGAALYLKRQPPSQPTKQPVAASSATTAAAISHPISQAQTGPAAASTAPLPPLDASDDSVLAALSALAGNDTLRGLLLDSHLIERIVATVDALPRHELGRNILPMHTPKGRFVVTDANGGTVIGDANYARYAPYMQAIEHVDNAALVAWYVHAYPLFQQAYRDLGYPDGYFNDRLVVAIDDLLAAPDPQGPVALRPERGHYVYADPALESLSTGQRMLIRSGPANEARLKARLRDIRARLTGVTLPATPAPATAPASAGSTPAATP